MSDFYNDEYFDPAHVNDGTPSRKTSEDGERKDRAQLVQEIDYDRVKQEIEDLYIPDHAIAEMLKDYELVTVRDFDDIYHKSEEERSKENKFYHLFTSLNNMSHRENNIDAFIIRARMTIDILKEIAENNGIISPTKFIKDYFDEKIIITGLPVPKLRGKFRKKYNMNYLMDFIMSDEDPSLFAPKRTEFGDDDEDIHKILPPEVIHEIEVAEPDPESTNCYFDDAKDQDGRNVAIVYSKKTAKDMSKSIPALLDASATIRKLEKSRNKMMDSINHSRFVGDIRDDDYERIESYDQTVYDNPDRIKEPEPPKDMSDQDAVNAYLTAMDYYIERTTYVDNHAGGMCTVEERDIEDIKSTLAENGFDIRAMYGYKEQKKKLKKIRKKEEKKEKELKDRLLRLEDRRDHRLGTGSGKRRLSDSDKKKQKKKKKKAKKASKNFIESATGQVLSKASEKEAFDMSWDM